VILTPSADTSLIEVAPSNNNGGQSFVLSGRTQNNPRNRGLFKFDLSPIPGNAVIQSVALTIEVTGQPGDGLANAPFGLYRMLRPWGEGGKIATNNPGQGMPAGPGEATWLFSFYPTNAWSEPGGAPAMDFLASASSFTFIYGLGQSPYRFESTPEFVDDVQGWLNQPQSNYGWMLLCDDEGTIFTARRFGSREDTNNAPLLEVRYLLPAQIDWVEKTGSQFNFGFVARAGQSYTVEFRSALNSGVWQTLANLGSFTETTRVLVVDTALVGQRFYRVATR